MPHWLAVAAKVTEFGEIPVPGDREQRACVGCGEWLWVARGVLSGIDAGHIGDVACLSCAADAVGRPVADLQDAAAEQAHVGTEIRYSSRGTTSSPMTDRATHSGELFRLLVLVE